MVKAIPVNNDILKWARETSGWSIAEVARKLKKTEDVIQSWEQGRTTPTYSQLERLAYDYYKRPTAIFFFPVIPQENSTRAEFRTLPENIVDAMPPEIVKQYKKAKVYQLNLKELDSQNDDKTSRLLDKYELKKDSNLHILSESIRKFINIDLKTQMSWKNLDEAFESWRNALVNCGIFIIKDAFRNNRYSGLSIYDKNYSIILINNSMPKSRQIFTIFHEVAHLLFKAGGVDILDESFFNRLHADYYTIEQKCNEFAGEFLLPDAVFLDGYTEFNEENVTDMADVFKVSREVILRKYLNHNLISSRMYKKYKEEWIKEYLDLRHENKGKKTGGDHYLTKKQYLGDYYIKLAFSHYYQEKISIETLAGYLGEKVGNVPTFEGYFLR